MKSFEVVLEFKMKVKSKMQRNSSKDFFKDFSFELIHPKSGVETVPKYVLKFPYNPPSPVSTMFIDQYFHPIFSHPIFSPNIFTHLSDSDQNFGGVSMAFLNEKGHID